jgi:sugar/nucleoside kinase (ribokinase family)
MKRFDVLVVGELNIDLILNNIDSFPVVGKEILAHDMNLTLGSSSAIFASNLSALGSKVAFLGMLGKDVFGELVIRSLEKKGVDTSMVIQSEKFNTGATIVLNFGEDRAMVTHPGAMEWLSLEHIKPELLEQARHLHFASYFLQPGLKKDVGELFKKAKTAGLTTSFDTQWDPHERWDLDIKKVIPYVDVFLPNEKELLFLTGEDSVEKAIEQIKDVVNYLVVKQGNKGSFSYYNGGKLFKPSFLNKRVVDAIGAGDSFNAGFIYKFVQNAPLDVCQEFGNLIGAISTTAPGGTGAFGSKEQVKKVATEIFGYGHPI